MNEVNLELKRLREEAGLTMRAVAEALGVGASTYAAYEDPKKFKKPLLPLHLAQQIAPLFAGNGVAASRVLSLAGLEGGAELQLEPAQLAQRLGLTMIPEADIAFSLGGGAVHDEFADTRLVPFRSDWLARLTRGKPADVFLTRGQGDSMMPTILDDDDVLVNRADRAIQHQDRIWALGYGELGMIKRVRRLPSGMFQLNSDNTAVTPIEATEDELHIVGRVVWIGRRV